jgi:hypothetical protein
MRGRCVNDRKGKKKKKKKKQKMNKIDKVFYIKLVHRTDRRVEIENELKNSFKYDRAIRYEAVLHESPILGCTMSHISIWREMLRNPEWNTIMVIEDDATLLTSREDLDTYIDAFLADENGDMLCIGNSCGEHVRYTDLLERGFNSQTSSCYVLKRKFVETLLRSYFKNPDHVFTLTEDEPMLGLHIYWIDVGWLELQKIHYFLLPAVRHGKSYNENPSATSVASL